MEATQTQAPSTPAAPAKPMTLAELTAAFAALSVQVKELNDKFEAAKPRNEATREMTDDDAKRILNGDLKDLKHKDAASKLGLSYGQIYSARGEFTFKHISKKLKEEGWKNPFVK